MPASHLNQEIRPLPHAESGADEASVFVGLWLGAPLVLALVGYLFFLAQADAFVEGGAVMLVVMLGGLIAAAPVIMAIWAVVILIAMAFAKIIGRW